MSCLGWRGGRLRCGAGKGLWMSPWQLGKEPRGWQACSPPAAGGERARLLLLPHSLLLLPHSLLPVAIFLPRETPHRCRPQTVRVSSHTSPRHHTPLTLPSRPASRPAPAAPLPSRRRPLAAAPPLPSADSHRPLPLPRHPPALPYCSPFPRSLPPSARGSRPPSALLHPSLLLLAVPPAPLSGADVTHPLKARAIMAAAAAAAAAAPPASS